MNRLVTDNAARLHEHLLPPAIKDGRTRVLFLSSDILGWSTFCRQLEFYAAQRDDLDAVHIRLKPPPWVRAIAHLFRWHAVDYWAWLLRGWRKNVLPFSRFDAVHVSPQQAARVLADCHSSNRDVPYSISFDVTHRQFEIELMGRQPPRQRGDDAIILKGADLLAPWSQWAERSLRQYYGIVGKETIVSPPCVPTHEEIGIPFPCQTPHGLLRIAFIGNDWIRKGGPRLLAWHQTRWADQAELHVFSAKTPVVKHSRNVVWHGALPNRTLVYEVLPTMDFLVMPTRCDMLGVVFLEAAVAGIPAVGSRVGAIPEVLKHGETGFIVDSDDDASFIAVIERLLSDADLRCAMGQAARQHARCSLNSQVVFNRLFDRVVAMAVRDNDQL